MSPRAVQDADGSVSRTSQEVALIRSSLYRPYTDEGDPEAQKRLCTGMKPTSTRWPMVERTRFFDMQVLSAISSRIRQIVICGAGYDDRALRFRTSGMRFFEIDHPTTQADKATRLEAMEANTDSLTMIAADFRCDDIAAKLEAADHNAAAPTLFICEGLLVYLSREVGSKLLSDLRSRAAAGSVLAASLAVHHNGVDSDRVAALVNARRQTGQTEPWLTILPLDSYMELLQKEGWQVNRVLNPATQGKEIHGGMILVTANPIPQLI